MLCGAQRAKLGSTRTQLTHPRQQQAHMPARQAGSWALYASQSGQHLHIGEPLFDAEKPTF